MTEGEIVGRMLCLMNDYTKPSPHPSLEMDLSLKFEVHEQTIWNSTPEL